jgi:DNA repair protein RecO (recombination protein O)
MTARTSHKTEAIVLRRYDYGESDRIIVFFTSDFGKLRGIAKGARRSRKRFSNTLEPFCCSRILFSRRGREGLALIEDSSVSCHFPAIRENLDKTLVASYLLDLTDQFTLEYKKNEALFRLLERFLHQIDGEAISEALIRFFEVRLLRVIGYEPVLDQCVACKTPVRNGDVYRFHPRAGGVKCESCGQNGDMALPLSPGTIRTLLMGRDIGMDRIGRLGMDPQSLEESRRLMHHFIRHLLGKELKSIEVLNQIRGMGV